MSDDDDTPLEELVKPLSAKVEPKRPSWSDTAGSRPSDQRYVRASAGMAWRHRLRMRREKDA